MSSQPSGTIGHDAAAALLQVSPDALSRLVGDGIVRRAAPGRYVPAQAIRDYIGHLHKKPESGDRGATQAEIAAHLDMSDRNVRDFLTSLGLDHKQMTLAALRVAYIRQLREEAAGRSGTLAMARAALDNERREEIAMRNAVKRREYLPAMVIAQVLARMGRQIAGILDGLVPAVRRRWPELTGEQLRLMESEIARARNLASALSVDDLLADAEEEAAA